MWTDEVEARRGLYIFGIDDIIIAGIASAAVGGGLSILGGSNANSANQANATQANLASLMMQQNQTAFNYDEAMRQRAFASDSQKLANQFTQEMVGSQQAFQQASQLQAMDYGMQTNQRAMDYNTAMSSTAWQRGVADMRAAGINPILAAVKGAASAPIVSGASVSPMSGSAGQGAMAGGTAASIAGGHGQMARSENVLAQGVSSAFQAAGAIGSLQRIRAEIGNIDADTTWKNAQALVSSAQEKTLNADTALKLSQEKNTQETGKLLAAQIISESQRPGMIQAQTGQAAAAAKHSTAQAAHEQERTYATQLEQILKSQAIDRADTAGVGGMGDTVNSLLKVIDNIAGSIGSVNPETGARGHDTGQRDSAAQRLGEALLRLRRQLR